MEFYDHRHAAASLAAMNGRKIMGKVSYRVYRVSLDGWALGLGNLGCVPSKNRNKQTTSGLLAILFS